MVITLSRQAEAGGEEIARLLCQRAGLRLADREALEGIARRQGLPVAQLAIFGAATPGRIEALVAQWERPADHSAFLRRLVQALLLLEREDNVLIIGRGAAFVLTDPGTLHVRVIAPMPCRVARLVQREAIHRGQAQRLLEASDKARAGFVRQTFDADISDPNHYDLTLSTAELTPDDAASIILVAGERKARSRTAPQEGPRDLLTHLARFGRRPLLPRVSEMVWRHCERRSAEG
jgi:cytidylate kinase